MNSRLPDWSVLQPASIARLAANTQKMMNFDTGEL